MDGRRKFERRRRQEWSFKDREIGGRRRRPRRVSIDRRARSREVAA